MPLYILLIHSFLLYYLSWFDYLHGLGLFDLFCFVSILVWGHMIYIVTPIMGQPYTLSYKLVPFNQLNYSDSDVLL